MSKIDWLDIAAKCISSTNQKEMHVNDMAETAIKLNLIKNQTSENIAIKLASSLASNVKRKNSRFKKVKNKTGGYKRGIYVLKPLQTTQLTRSDVPTTIATGYTGKAGEHAVLAELLFRGYNASIMAVDEGIDLVATKDNKYFHLQVKTANGDDSRPYQASIRKEAFQHTGNTFYILVLRRPQRRRYINDYLILSSNEIRRYIASGALRDGETIGLRLVIENEKFYLLGLNDRLDLTHCINDFESIS